MKRRVLFALIFLLCPAFDCYSSQKDLFWWRSTNKSLNFGDELSRVIVEKMIHKSVSLASLKSPDTILFAAGSVLHFARNGDVIWGSGFRESPLLEKRFTRLDVRAVRGPRTRAFLLQMGIPCPEVYGDPALLLPYLFPEFKREEPLYEYSIIPNIGEIQGFIAYKNVILPTEPWDIVVRKILKSRFVISSSLHGLIVAEAFGIPARLLKMTMIEKLLKYQDYYESTGRPNFTYATSVQEALRMGGEIPGHFDIQPLLESFPYEYFSE